MASNLVRKVFTANATLVVPAGVRSMRVTLIDKLRPAFVAGSSASFFTTTGGNLFGMGANAFAQLGINSVACPYSSPILIPRLNGLEPLAMRHQSVGLICDRRGIIYGWGLNTGSGLLGQDPAFVTTIPMQVPLFNDIKEWRTIAQGSACAYAIDINGAIYGWGANLNGELGDGTFNAPKSSPVLIVGSAIAKYVDAGGTNMAYIDSAGALWTLGTNAVGALGDGTTASKSSPVAIAGGGVWQDIAVGFNGMIGLDSSGNVWAWGDNTQGQLGDGTVVAKSSPIMIISSSTLSVARVFANGGLFGPRWSAVLTTDGKIYMWGGNANGQLGQSDVVSRSTPTLVSGTQVFAHLSLGADHCLATDTTGQLWAWGFNGSGHLGDGTVVPKSSPTLITTTMPVLPRPNQVVERRSVAVTPGASLPVVLAGRFISFGSEILGAAQNAQLVVEYNL